MSAWFDQGMFLGMADFEAGNYYEQWYTDGHCLLPVGTVESLLQQVDHMSTFKALLVLTSASAKGVRAHADIALRVLLRCDDAGGRYSAIRLLKEASDLTEHHVAEVGRYARSRPDSVLDSVVADLQAAWTRRAGAARRF